MNMKKATKLTQEQLDELEALNNLPEEQINTDDVPEVREWTYFRRGAFYRPDDARGTVTAMTLGRNKKKGRDIALGVGYG